MNKLKPSRKYVTTRKIYKTILYIVLSIAVFIVLANATFNIIYIETSVKGFSMRPTLNATVPNVNEDGDVVFVNRFIQGDVGDIIVAVVPWGINKAEVTVIKRLVAVGGDQFKFVRNGTDIEFWKNGKLLAEDYVKVSQENECAQFEQLLYENETTQRFEIENGYLIVPDKYVLLLGDNRADSTDGSLMGPVSKNAIIGRVDFVVKYGDNVKKNIFNIIFNIFRFG